MKKKTIVFLLCIMTLIFVACDKDKEETNNINTYDPLAGNNANSKDDSDSWWKNQASDLGTNKSQSEKTSVQKGKANKTQNKNNDKTTAKNNTGSARVSNNTTKKSQPKDTEQSLPYKKINQYTMTFSNTNGGTTTLTKDPSDRYIQKAISMIDSDIGESVSALQMMSISDSSDKSGIRAIYIYSSASGKSLSSLKYVILLKSDTSAVSFLTSNDGTGYAPFPFATSGTEKYMTYYNQYKGNMDAVDSGAYTGIKEKFKLPHNDPNVTTFLSW